MNKIYYNQADSRWANHTYPSTNHPKATIKSGGCGATSAAMIVSSFRQTIYPNQMGDIFRANGLRAPEGTSPTAFTWIAKKYNLKEKTTAYISEAVECLKRGGMCVAYCKAGGLFSTGGHIIVLADIRGNNLVVYDPYLYAGKFNSGNRKCVKVNGVEAIVSIDNFKKYCNYTLYCYEDTNSSKYKQGQSVEINTPFYFTGGVEGDLYLYDNKVRQNNKDNLCRVHADTKSLVKYDRLIARATFVFDEGDRCLVQVFNDQFWIKKSEITKIL